MLVTLMIAAALSGCIGSEDDTEPIDEVIDDVVDNNVKSVSDYLEGNLNVLRFLVGQVMKETKGKANPQKATELLQEKLESLNNR